jgi:regulator of sigma E protease
MQIIINLIVFLFILTTIVSIHEFGHFIAAKIFGVYCGAFSIGMGPKIFHKKGKETEFQIRALPIGGFVSMAGEADQEDNEEFKDLPVERTLKGKKTYQKVIIFLAGIFMNFVLAIVIMLVLNVSVGTTPVNNCVIGQVLNDTPAQKAGLKVNDQIIAITDQNTHQEFPVESIEGLNKALAGDAHNNEKTVSLIVTIKRDGKKQDVPMSVTYQKDAAGYKLGIMQKTRRLGIGEAFTNTFTTIGTMSLAIFNALKLLVVNFTSTVKQMSGPVGIYKVTASVTENGQVAEIFYLMALLSVNIGIFNLMPVPGLDGAQTLFAIVEGAIGRELPINVKYALQAAGLGLILLLMFYITFQDIIKLF